MARLIVVSNRLPCMLQPTGTGVELPRSAGGLASALEPYLRARKRADPSFECVWLGWPGSDVADRDQAALRLRMHEEHGATPVFLPHDDANDSHRGFCNETLWPLFHYFPSHAIYNPAAMSPAVAKQRAQIEASVRGRQVVFSVDRLDYTKGIVDRLLGFQEFLCRYPQWLGKVVFTLAVVPSSVDKPRDERMKQELDELVGRINGELGTMDWVPVSYLYQSLDFETLVALYSLASVALITPLRDGMNLVAKEYLASKPDGTGVLILSELAGAAQELGEAVLVNPNHHGEIAEALEQALTMAPEEQIRRNRSMQERLRAQNAQHWAAHFLSALEQTKS